MWLVLYFQRAALAVTVIKPYVLSDNSKAIALEQTMLLASASVGLGAPRQPVCF